jgi:hypothetical protein
MMKIGEGLVAQEENKIADCQLPIKSLPIANCQLPIYFILSVETPSGLSNRQLAIGNRQ